MIGKVVEIGSVLWSFPRMGSIFWLLVEAIPYFVKILPKRGVERFEVLVSCRARVLLISLRIGLRFYLKYWLVATLGCESPPRMRSRVLGFAKRPDHCVEEDILKQGMGNSGVCEQNLDVSRDMYRKIYGLGFELFLRKKYSWPNR